MTLSEANGRSPSQIHPVARPIQPSVIPLVTNTTHFANVPALGHPSGHESSPISSDSSLIQSWGHDYNPNSSDSTLGQTSDGDDYNPNSTDSAIGHPQISNMRDFGNVPALGQWQNIGQDSPGTSATFQANGNKTEDPH
jgi:hypothetical protein